MLDRNFENKKPEKNKKQENINHQKRNKPRPTFNLLAKYALTIMSVFSQRIEQT